MSDQEFYQQLNELIHKVETNQEKLLLEELLLKLMDAQETEDGN